MLHPLITILRGLRLLAVSGRQKWAATPKERRGPKLFLAAACVLAVALVPYGPILALITVMGAAAWKGRERTPVQTGPDEAESTRLRALYEALVPYFSVSEDPDPLFAHGGDWEKAFDGYTFDGDGRLTRLQVSYPAYFTDGEAAARSRIEQLLHTKSGRGREYRFDWDEEANRLVMTVPAPLSTSIAAQRFVTAPGETVLGFTDPDAVRRTVPVRDGDTTVDAYTRLADRQPLHRTPSARRRTARQRHHHPDPLHRRPGPAAGRRPRHRRQRDRRVRHPHRAHRRPGRSSPGLGGALATLEWAAHETERRLIFTNRARQGGRPVPEDVKRPLYPARGVAVGDRLPQGGQPGRVVAVRVGVRRQLLHGPLEGAGQPGLAGRAAGRSSSRATPGAAVRGPGRQRVPAGLRSSCPRRAATPEPLRPQRLVGARRWG
ncbi:hypothetical protein SMICM17S_08693 [Streptomyces microflavus]